MAKDLLKEILGRTPNHYDLLGLKLFESDQALIKQAGLESTEKVQQWELVSDKDTAEQVQELKRDVCRAIVVLSDEKQKKEYDAGLAKQLENVMPPHSGATKTDRESSSSESSRDIEDSDQAPRQTSIRLIKTDFKNCAKCGRAIPNEMEICQKCASKLERHPIETTKSIEVPPIPPPPPPPQADDKLENPLPIKYWGIIAISIITLIVISVSIPYIDSIIREEGKHALAKRKKKLLTDIPTAAAAARTEIREKAERALRPILANGARVKIYENDLGKIIRMKGVSSYTGDFVNANPGLSSLIDEYVSRKLKIIVNAAIESANLDETRISDEVSSCPREIKDIKRLLKSIENRKNKAFDYLSKAIETETADNSSAKKRKDKAQKALNEVIRRAESEHNLKKSISLLRKELSENLIAPSRSEAKRLLKKLSSRFTKNELRLLPEIKREVRLKCEATCTLEHVATLYHIKLPIAPPRLSENHVIRVARKNTITATRALPPLPSKETLNKEVRKKHPYTGGYYSKYTKKINEIINSLQEKQKRKRRILKKEISRRIFDETYRKYGYVKINKIWMNDKDAMRTLEKIRLELIEKNLEKEITKRMTHIGFIKSHGKWILKRDGEK